MISLKAMTPEQVEHYSNFSFEKYLSESAKSSGENIEEVRRRAGGPPNRPTENDLWLAIQSKDQCIGFMWIQLHPMKKEAFIYDFYIDSDCRSKGLGRETLVIGLELMKKRSIEKLKLCVYQDNTIARKLYSSVGFKDTNFSAERKQYTLELPL